MDYRGPYSEDLDVAINNAFYLGMVGVESEIEGREIRSCLVSRSGALERKEDDISLDVVSRVLELPLHNLGLAAMGAYISKGIVWVDESHRNSMIRCSSRFQEAIEEYKELYTAIRKLTGHVGGLPTPA